MPDRSPIHLRPAAPLAERVLLPDDPHWALQVAQHVLEHPRMFNHHRGLWGYSGVARDGLELSVQSTGMGGPSTAIVVEELVALGATTLVRIGTCGALAARLALGDLIVAREALVGDGASAALGATGSVCADAALSGALARAASAHEATIASADLFYATRPGAATGWSDRGAVAVEMEAATLFAVAARHGLAAACVCVVSDIVSTRERIGDEALIAAEQELGRVALAALA
jgi:DeoD family purine-nucleoside phosphorylase